MAEGRRAQLTPSVSVASSASAASAAARALVHHSSVRTSAGDAEAIEMRAFQRRGAGPGRSLEAEDAGSRHLHHLPQHEQHYVHILHQVEPHHTLTGIALQYRVTVDQLKRLNNMWTEQELHSRKTVKIPTMRDGFLYHAVHETGGAALGPEILGDADTKTHTTMKPLPAESHGPRPAFRVERFNPDEPVSSAYSSTQSLDSSDFLRKFDAELSEALQAQRRIEETAEQRGASPAAGLYAYMAPRASSSAWNEWLPSWSTVLIAVIVVAVVIPVIFYKVLPHVRAPPPQQHSSGPPP